MHEVKILCRSSALPHPPSTIVTQLSNYLLLCSTLLSGSWLSPFLFYLWWWWSALSFFLCIRWTRSLTLALLCGRDTKNIQLHLAGAWNFHWPMVCSASLELSIDQFLCFAVYPLLVWRSVNTYFKKHSLATPTFSICLIGSYEQVYVSR